MKTVSMDSNDFGEIRSRGLPNIMKYALAGAGVKYDAKQPPYVLTHVVRVLVTVNILFSLTV